MSTTENSSKKNRLQKNIRIAIIGAGPSGLGAAEALKEKGFDNITIFEKRNRVGGMAHSKIYEDENGKKVTYDLGSLQPVGSSRLFQLLKQNNLHLGKSFAKDRTLKFRIFSIKEKRYVADFLEYPLGGVGIKQLPGLFLDGIKLIYWIIKYRRFAETGFDTIHNKEPLAEPFPSWIKKRRFKTANRILTFLFSNYLNGGVIEKEEEFDHSMIYALKAMSNEALNPPLRYMMGKLLPITEGYQTIWNIVAKKHNVLLNSNITKIDRIDGKITIKVNDIDQIFDRLIIACPPADLMDVMKTTDKEQQIFSKICYSPTWAATFVAKNLPSDAVYAFIDPTENGDTKICSGFQPEGELSDGNWLYRALIGYHDVTDIEEYLTNSEIIFKTIFNATSIKWIDKAYWPKYNSHFKCQDIKNGIYEEFESIQSHCSTYYVGEILAGLGNGNNLDYSYKLVDRFFTN